MLDSATRFRRSPQYSTHPFSQKFLKPFTLLATLMTLIASGVDDGDGNGEDEEIDDGSLVVISEEIKESFRISWSCNSSANVAYENSKISFSFPTA